MNSLKIYFSTLSFIFFILFVNIVVTDWYDYKNKLISLEIKSSVNGTAQLFYDAGSGINENDSKKHIVTKKNDFTNIKFRIPRKEDISFLRLDPIDKVADIQIKNIRVVRGNGEFIESISLNSFSPHKGIKDFSIKDNILTLSVENDTNDPILHINDLNILYEKNRFYHFSLDRLPILLLYFFISLTLLYYSLRAILFSTAVRQYSILCIDYIKIISKSRPLSAIFVVSVISIVINMYPLLFGKSMNYAAGLPMLYDTLGWMPGYEFDGFFEDFRGADVAAHQWIFSPMSMIVHQSVFQYGEFPFWNRFVAGGVPLYGQGYSMLGDPIQWITVFYNGSSISWDIKFTLSKFIFSIGCGLLAFRISKNVTISMVIAAAAPFIGFYTHVFNHPNYFSLTYLPLGILQWIRFTESLKSFDLKLKNILINFILLVVVMWLIINSSQTKEAVISFAFIFGWGLLYMVLCLSSRYKIINVISITTIVLVTIILFVSPYVIIFLSSLFESATSYDGKVPTDPYPTSLIFGFFEPLVFQEWTSNHPLKMQKLVGLSSNILFLFLLIWAINTKLKGNHIFQSTIVFFLISFSIAYGLMPDIIIQSIPLVNRIGHNGITFGIPLVMFTVILSTYGAMNLNKKDLTLYCIKFWMIFTLLTILVISHFYIDDNIIHTLSFLAFLSIGLYIIKKLTSDLAYKNKTVELLTITFLTFMTLKNGMHLQYGKTFDNYLLNPNLRMNTNVSNDAINIIKNNNKINGPERVIGEGLNFIPGTNIYFGIESIGSAEALKNPYLEEYYKVFGIEKVPGWDWMRLYEPDKITAIQNIAYDSLNVGYFISSPGKVNSKKYNMIHKGEIDLFKRDSVWPRAYFTNNLIKVSNNDEYLDEIIKANGPTALVFSDVSINSNYKNDEAANIIAASNYSLTPNSTCFDVSAISPGVIVLLEGYDKDDYILEVNGETKEYFRTNFWSKGFYVENKGNYNVCYKYKPNSLNIVKYSFSASLILILLFPILIKLFRSREDL